MVCVQNWPAGQGDRKEVVKGGSMAIAEQGREVVGLKKKNPVLLSNVVGERSATNKNLLYNAMR